MTAVQRLRASSAAGVLLAQACTTVVVPPRDPTEPLPAFLVDHGRHASLVLPRGDDGIVRYSYGDWTYYAQVETGATEASAALLWPTRAGLGRRELAGLPGAAAVRRQLRVPIERLYRVVVESDSIERLRAHLDSIFETNIETLVYNRSYDLEFVHHPEAYSILRNSNEVVAAWLRNLGCEVRGSPILSSWKVQTERFPSAARSGQHAYHVSQNRP